jgi:hypothetical protein
VVEHDLDIQSGMSDHVSDHIREALPEAAADPAQLLVELSEPQVPECRIALGCSRIAQGIGERRLRFHSCVRFEPARVWSELSGPRPQGGDVAGTDPPSISRQKTHERRAVHRVRGRPKHSYGFGHLREIQQPKRTYDLDRNSGAGECAVQCRNLAAFAYEYRGGLLHIRSPDRGQPGGDPFGFVGCREVHCRFD